MVGLALNLELSLTVLGSGLSLPGLRFLSRLRARVLRGCPWVPVFNCRVHGLYLRNNGSSRALKNSGYV